jgi:release factor glutamine methyltransferase
MAADRVWTVRESLDWTVGYFERAGVESPRRSAEWLLSAATGLSRVELYAHFDRPLTNPERAAFRESIERRAKGEPLQYVTGEVAFRHLVLKVEPGVFIPRPETEVLVDEALRELPHGGVAIDLCAGSGAVAISIAYERPDVSVVATELSEATAAVARANAERAGVADRVTVLTGDLFAPLPAELRAGADVVVANPPYVPSGDMASLPAEVSAFEPHVALDGGPDGLDVARRIIEGARGWLRPGCVLLMELDTDRVKDAVRIMDPWYEDCEVRLDLTGRDRFAAGRTRRV